MAVKFRGFGRARTRGPASQEIPPPGLDRAPREAPSPFTPRSSRLSILTPRKAVLRLSERNALERLQPPTRARNSKRGNSPLSPGRCLSPMQKTNLASRFALGIAIYFLAHAVLRAALSDSLELDEGEQMLFSQWLRWGYSEQPPLYTWVQQALFALLGHHVFALALLKNALLFLAYLFVFLSGRRLFGDERRAALAALSLLLIPSVAWGSQRDLTHTVLAMALAAMHFCAALHLLSRRTTAACLLLGFSLGLGILSKYNFCLYAAALIGALLTLREQRTILVDPRVLAGVALTLPLLIPHVLWVSEHSELLASGMQHLPAGSCPSRLHLTGKLAAAAVSFLALPTFIWGLFFLRPRARGSVGLPASPGGKAEEPSGASLGRTLLGRYFLFLPCIVIGFVWLSGIDRVRTRWLQPMFFLWPLWLFARVEPAALTALRFRRYLALTLTAAVVVFAAMSVRVLGARWTDPTTDFNYPFAEFAARLRARGFTRGVVIAHNNHLAGNLLYQFQGEVAAYSPALPIPREIPAGTDVLLAWDARKNRGEPAKLISSLDARLASALERLPIEYLEAAYRHSPKTLARIGFILLRMSEPGPRR